MSKPAARPAGNRAALIAAPVIAVVLYVVVVTLLLIIFFRPAIDGLWRNDFASAVLRWTIYLLPALVAPAVAALFNALFFGESGRRAAFWPNLAIIVAFTGVAVGWLLIQGGFWNDLLAAFQLACGGLAWFLLHKTARGHAKR